MVMSVCVTQLNFVPKNKFEHNEMYSSIILKSYGKVLLDLPLYNKRFFPNNIW